MNNGLIIWPCTGGEESQNGRNGKRNGTNTTGLMEKLISQQTNGQGKVQGCGTKNGERHMMDLGRAQNGQTR